MTTSCIETGGRIVRHVEHVMGMPISVALRGAQADTLAGRRAWERVVDELRGVDRVFSTYRSESVINQLDRGDLDLEECPPDVEQVLALGRLAEHESAGAFSVWLPASPADPDGRRRLDPSGVVKGWAAERAARHLAALDDTDFCLSAGGDIIGRAAIDRKPWQIGIEDPFDLDKIAAVIPLRTGAVATSGLSRRGAHLVDARTGRVPHGLASVTVIGPSLAWADIDATAAFAQGVEAVPWLRCRPIHGAFVINADGSTQTVSGPLPRHCSPPTSWRTLQGPAAGRPLSSGRG